MVALRTPDDAEIDENRSRFRIAGMPLPAIAFLILTVVISLLWSHCELLWGDEFGILTTDSVSSVRTLIHVQRATPISLDQSSTIWSHMRSSSCSGLVLSRFGSHHSSAI